MDHGIPIAEDGAFRLSVNANAPIEMQNVLPCGKAETVFGTSYSV
jgi:hypothetical protein